MRSRSGVLFLVKLAETLCGKEKRRENLLLLKNFFRYTPDRRRKAIEPEGDLFPSPLLPSIIFYLTCCFWLLNMRDRERSRDMEGNTDTFV